MGYEQSRGDLRGSHISIFLCFVLPRDPWPRLGSQKNPKMVITRVPGGPAWPEFGMHLPTIPSKIFPCPKDPNFNCIKGFKHFWGGHKSA